MVLEVGTYDGRVFKIGQQGGLLHIQIRHYPVNSVSSIQAMSRLLSSHRAAKASVHVDHDCDRCCSRPHQKGNVSCDSIRSVFIAPFFSSHFTTRRSVASAFVSHGSPHSFSLPRNMPRDKFHVSRTGVASSFVSRASPHSISLATFSSIQIIFS